MRSASASTTLKPRHRTRSRADHVHAVVQRAVEPALVSRDQALEPALGDGVERAVLRPRA